jgi:hypothetical protein
MLVPRLRPVAALLAAGGLSSVLILSCGGGGGAPSSPSTPSTPAPTAQPTATPPTGGGGVGSSSCSLGNGSPSAECGKSSARLIDAIFTAQDLLLQQKPQIFDKSLEAGDGSGQYLVVDKEAYLNGILSVLAASGYCAERDPEDFNYERILVKNENGFSETYDVITGQGYMRRGGGIYLQTCTPASFPVDLGTEVPPAGSGCGKPYPPPISRFNVKVHIPGGEAYPDALDSTPIVGPDPMYCAQVGFPERAFCPVRVEGDPERVPCETWAVGYARDTGRPGPTWTRQPDGTLCTGKESGCWNHEANQYKLYAWKGGTYRVTGRNGAYGEVVVDRAQ